MPRYQAMGNKEVDIILLLQKGDNAGYKYLFEHYYPLLCTVAYEFLKDDFLAETIVDDLIFHLWERREALHITTSLRGYLVRAVRNRCINYLQLERERREVTFSSINMDEKNTLLYSESLEYPMASLLENELEGKIIQSIRKLPDECRRVFELSRFEEKRYDEIALQLGISVNTVKYHIKNALKHLYEDLEKYLHAFLICWIFF